MVTLVKSSETSSTSFFSTSPNDPQIIAFMNRIEQAIQRGEYENAIQMIDDAVAKYQPLLADVVVIGANLAKCNLRVKMKDYENALEEIDQAIDLFEQHLTTLGQEMGNQREVEDALSAFQIYKAALLLNLDQEDEAAAILKNELKRVIDQESSDLSFGSDLYLIKELEAKLNTQILPSDFVVSSTSESRSSMNFSWASTSYDFNPDMFNMEQDIRNLFIEWLSK